MKTTHTHIDSDGNIIKNTHEVHETHQNDGVHTKEYGPKDSHVHDHGHYHSPEEKKRQLNRISRAAGHLQHVKSMIENDESCDDVLIQLSAVESAIHNLGKEIINEHMTHCIIHAIEDGDMESVEKFQEAIKRFM